MRPKRGMEDGETVLGGFWAFFGLFSCVVFGSVVIRDLQLAARMTLWLRIPE